MAIEGRVFGLKIESRAEKRDKSLVFSEKEVDESGKNKLKCRLCQL